MVLGHSLMVVNRLNKEDIRKQRKSKYLINKQRSQNDTKEVLGLANLAV